ncbi:MAG: hypothetical protein HFG37_02760 [Eubacterium sp.]|nr:hypothetical protein [Eubacterium sp.]
MQRIQKMLLALAVVVLVFGGTNALATSRGCSLNNAKTVETTNSCTVKASTGSYKVTANHSPNSNSSELIVGLNEWNVAISAYKYRKIFTLSKNTATIKYPAYRTGKWAKLRLTAGSSRATGTGLISNEF